MVQPPLLPHLHSNDNYDDNLMIIMIIWHDNLCLPTFVQAYKQMKTRLESCSGYYSIVKGIKICTRMYCIWMLCYFCSAKKRIGKSCKTASETPWWNQCPIASMLTPQNKGEYSSHLAVLGPLEESRGKCPPALVFKLWISFLSFFGVHALSSLKMWWRST